MSRKVSFFLVMVIVLSGLFSGAVSAKNEDNNDNQQSQTIQIEQFVFYEDSCSFTARLLGASIEDSLYVTVYSDTNKMKSTAIYTGGEELSVKVKNLSTSDHIKLVWIDSAFCPRANALLLDLERYKADSYADFAEQTRTLFQTYSQYSPDAVPDEDGAAENFSMARLIIRPEDPLPGLDTSGAVETLTDPDGHVILQFATPDNAKRYLDYLDALDYNGTVEEDVLFFAYEQGNGTSMSWGVDATHIGEYASGLAHRGIHPVVVAAVVDTGIDGSHPALENRLTEGYDVITGQTEAVDRNGHGTHVGGTIVDCTPESGVLLMPVRVLGDNGYGTSLTVGQGIRYAADHGANVINLSLGGSHSEYIDESISYALSKNVTVVVAAGNESADTRNSCPAHISGCITVSAVDSRKQQAQFSNYGDAVDIAAPGVGILSLLPGSGTGVKSGTSMAAPHVTAAAALLISEYGTDSTPAEIETLLRDAAEDHGDVGWDPVYGSGFLNLEAFLDQPNAHEYLLLDTGLEWSDARSYCSRLGGHLMTVESSEEQEILERLLQDGDRNLYWLGGGLTYQDRYSWITDEPFSYTHWAENKPDNRTGVEDSLAVYRVASPDGSAFSGEWDDLPQNGVIAGETFYGLENMGLLCEWDGERPERTVTYDANGGSDSNGTVVERKVPVASTVAVAGNLFACGGWSFTGWNTAADGTGTEYQEGGALFVPEDVTLYAQWRRDESAFAVLYDGGELVFQNTQEPRRENTVIGSYPVATTEEEENPTPAWYEMRASVTAVTIEDVIHPVTMERWFEGCEQLKRVSGIQNLDSESVSSMRRLFFGCFNIGKLDLSGLDTSHVTDMREMFSGCSSLALIVASESFTTEQVRQSESMFQDCTALKGGEGTEYQNTHTDAAYARIDGGETQPGYFTKASSTPAPQEPNTELYAVLYSDGELVFRSGSSPEHGRVAVKNYVTGSDGRDGGLFPAWYGERDQILYVTFADLTVPESTALWFYNCGNLKEIRGTENLYTGFVTDMTQMFSLCRSLVSLDLSGLDTARVEKMSLMFYACKNLTTLDLSGIRTNALTDTQWMFSGCDALRTIYADETFSTDQIERDTGMFENCVSLSGGAGTLFYPRKTDKSYACMDEPPTHPGYFSRR